MSTIIMYGGIHDVTLEHGEYAIGLRRRYGRGLYIDELALAVQDTSLSHEIHPVLAHHHVFGEPKLLQIQSGRVIRLCN